VTALERRLVRLEGAVAGPAAFPYVVWVPPDALGNAEAVRAAIAKHLRRTDWTGTTI
jgi:hypothetical protein